MTIYIHILFIFYSYFIHISFIFHSYFIVFPYHSSYFIFHAHFDPCYPNMSTHNSFNIPILLLLLINFSCPLLLCLLSIILQYSCLKHASFALSTPFFIWIPTFQNEYSHFCRYIHNMILSKS